MRRSSATALVWVLVALGVWSRGEGAEAGALPGTLPEVHRVGDSGPALLLVPCMSCRWRSFDAFMERNAERFRMAAVTLPGFGGTPVPDLPRNSGEPLWQQNALAGLSALLDEQDLGPVVVVGHSFGGDMAVRLAARRPDLVRGLVLIDSWPMSDRSWFPDTPDLRLEQANRTVARQLAQFRDLDEWQKFNLPTLTDPERRVLYHGWFMATPQEVLLQYWRENLLSDLNPLLPRLEMPVLDVKAIAPGTPDPEQARRSRREAWARNGTPPQLELRFVENCRHFIHEEQPEQIDRLIGEFLDRLASPARP